MYSRWEIYQCVAAGVFLLFSMTRAADPEVIQDPKSTTWNVFNRDPQELSCAARGSGNIKIDWYKDGELITFGNNRIRVSVTVRDMRSFSSLHFVHIKKSDEGDYQCVVRSQKGSPKRSATATLTIYGPPSVNSKSPLPKQIFVSWHERFSLPCKGKGPPDLTKVTWFYEVLSPGNTTLFSGMQNKRLSDTELERLPREDDARSRSAAKYKVKCEVFNREGSQKSTTTTIYIKQAPGTPVITKVTPLEFGRIATLHWKPGSDGYDKLNCKAEISSNKDTRRSPLPMNNNADEYKKYISNLKPVTLYSVRVQCNNSIGASDWTQRKSFTTKEGYPDQAPRDIKAIIINSTAVNISWSPIPSDHVFGTLLGYNATLTQGSKMKIKITGANETHTQFSGLNPGSKYCAKVLGFTEARGGEISKLTCVSLPFYDSINSPIIKQITTAQGVVTFEYVDGDNPRGALSNCSIVISDAEHHEIRVRIAISDKVAEKTVRNLFSNQRYDAIIECTSTAGARVKSKKKMFRTSQEKPQIAPENLGWKADEDKLTVYWDNIDMSTLNSYGNFTGYNICIVPADENEYSRCIVRVDKANYAFSNLEPSKTYTVTVAACTNAGCGPQAFKVVHMPQWVTKTPKPTTKITAFTTKAVPVVVTGHFNFVYAGIGVLVVAIFIVALALYLLKRKRQNENQRQGIPAVVYDSHGNEQQSAMSSPSDTLNPYEVPLLSTQPLLSVETLGKLEGVKFTRDRLLLGDRLGKGEFGRVYKGKFRSPQPTGQEDEEGNLVVAVKTMIMEEYDASEREEFVKEGLRMKDMDHPNVMKLIGICLPEDSTGGHSRSRILSGFEAISPLVVVPYMENGDLKNYLYNARMQNDMKHITLNNLLHFAYDIANGMEYLSQKNIVHRDLACRNCMLDSNMNVVVSDFGLSRQIYSSNYYRQKRAAKMPVKWMALESLVDRIYNSMTDVWSFGVTVWEIFTFCQNPYPGVQNHEMHELLKAGTRLKRPKHCLNDIWNDAIYPCWDPRPEERPTFSELVEMFSGYLKVYTADTEGGVSSNPVYVNVLPPDGYETLTENADEPLLRSNTISSENNDIPMPYHSAIEKNDSSYKREHRRKSSSTKKLLKEDNHAHSSSTGNGYRDRQDRGRRRQKDAMEEFVVEL